MSEEYVRAGIILGMLFGICAVIVSGRVIILHFRKSGYKKRWKRVCFSPNFYYNLQAFYQQTADIRKTLEVMHEQYPKGAVAVRIAAAIEYLDNSHYRDYEIALYQYLMDERQKESIILSEILLSDLLKQRRLPDKGAERIIDEK